MDQACQDQRKSCQKPDQTPEQDIERNEIMKIKKYKVVCCLDNNDYDVYTNDLPKLVRDNPNGCDLGFVYLKGSVGWISVPRDLKNIDRAGFNPYFPDNLPKAAKTKEKAAKRLVKHQNKLLREMKL